METIKKPLVGRTSDNDRAYILVKPLIQVYKLFLIL